MWSSSIKMFAFVLIAMVAATGLLMQFNAKLNQKSKDLYLYDGAILKPNETIMNTTTKEEHPLIVIEPHNPSDTLWKQYITPEYLQNIFQRLAGYTADGKIYSPQSDAQANANKNIYFVLKQKAFVSWSVLKQYLDNGVGKILENNIQGGFTMYYFPMKYIIPTWTPNEQEVKKASRAYRELVWALEQTCRMPREWQLYCN